MKQQNKADKLPDLPGNQKVGDYKSSDEEKKTGFDATYATGNDAN